MVSAEKELLTPQARREKVKPIKQFVFLPLALVLMSCNLISRFDFLISQLKERIFFNAREEKDEMRETRRKVEKEAKKFRVDCIFERFRRLWAIRAMLLIAADFLSPWKLIEI